MRPTSTRRHFLKSAGGTVVGLPFLGSLLPAKAEAQAARTPTKRFVVFFHPNGVIPSAWFPTPGGNERTFTIATCHEPLTPFRDKVIWTSGIDMKTSKSGPGERHQTGMGGLLTGRPLLPGNFVGGDGSLAGWGSGISVDQRIAQEIGRDTPLASLQLGVRASGAEVRHRLSYSGPAQPLPPQNDPRAVHQRLFSNMGAPPEEVLRLRRQRKSVLDAVMDQFGRLDRRLGNTDKQKLDAHLELVRDVERRLDTIPIGGSCVAPTEPAARDPDSEVTMPDIADLQVDLLAIALACDLTRVGSIQNSNAENHIRFPWVNSLGDGHALSHGGPSSRTDMAELIVRDTWYATKFARLLGRLDAVSEGDGTVLDNSVIMWGSELAVGNVHTQINMPFVIAGKGGGYFRTGRFLQFSNASHCDLLLSFLHAFGVYDATFGLPEFCTGPLTGMAA